MNFKFKNFQIDLKFKIENLKLRHNKIFKNIWKPIVFVVVFLILPSIVFARTYYKSDLGLNVHWSLGGIGGGVDRDSLYEARMLDGKVPMAREHFQTDVFYLESRDAWFARYDAILAKYKQNNIQVLAMVAYNESGGKGPPNLDEWYSFLQMLVLRYKDQIKYWEIWNEPDSPDYLTPHNPETYAPILTTAYSAIKAIDPEAKILSAGLASPNPYFAKKLYKLAGNSFDIFAFHAYYCGAYFENGNVDSFEHKLDQVKEVVEQNKPGQDVWITEFGCSQNGGAISETQQRDYFKYILPKIYAKNFVDKIFLYNIRDYDYWTTYENGFGLTDLNLEPKLAWQWYQKIYIGPYNQLILSSEQETLKSKELTKKLEKYFGKNQIPDALAWQDILDAYIYGGYKPKSLAQALRFNGKTLNANIPLVRWKNSKNYKKYINRDWYGGKLIQKGTYKKARLSQKQEQKKAKELRAILEKNYKFDKLQIDANNWRSLLFAYIYGSYPVKAIARAGKFPQIIHDKIPYSRWKNSSVYKFYVGRKVY